MDRSLFKRRGRVDVKKEVKNGTRWKKQRKIGKRKK